MTKLDSTFVEEAVVEMEQSKTEAAYETDSRSIHVQVDPDAGLSVDEREQIVSLIFNEQLYNARC